VSHRRSATATIVLATLVSAAVVRAYAPPARIISLVPNVTEMLFAIGAGPRVVAVGTFDNFPPEVDKLPRVGALLDPNVEKILSLKPDLVVVYGAQTDLQQQLGRAQIPVFSYRHGGLRDVAATIRLLGTRTGDIAQADRVAGSLEQQIEQVRSRVAGRARLRTLVVFGREAGAIRSVNVSGATGFIHDMLEAAGGRNVAVEPRESVQLNTESILALAPDVILELRYTGERSSEAVARAAGEWRVLASVPAVRNGRVHIVVGDEYVVPGPRIGQATEALARVLHPEAFRPGPGSRAPGTP
jgi:cobalamin transport system substrate-binding protein